jgi:hypothetical protein
LFYNSRPPLSDNRYRVYDPYTGGYLQADPELGRTWDPYGYARQSPTRFIDRTGLEESTSSDEGARDNVCTDQQIEGGYEDIGGQCLLTGWNWPFGVGNKAFDGCISETCDDLGGGGGGSGGGTLPGNTGGLGENPSTPTPPVCAPGFPVTTLDVDVSNSHACFNKGGSVLDPSLILCVCIFEHPDCEAPMGLHWVYASGSVISGTVVNDQSGGWSARVRCVYQTGNLFPIQKIEHPKSPSGTLRW